VATEQREDETSPVHHTPSERQSRNSPKGGHHQTQERGPNQCGNWNVGRQALYFGDCVLPCLAAGEVTEEDNAVAVLVDVDRRRVRNWG